VAKLPTAPAKNETEEFDRFKDFARRVVSVPYSTIKARLDAEKEAKRTAKASSFRASVSSSSRDT